MIRQVGTQVQLSTTIRDTSGTPVNTPTVVLSVTKPDGTALTPAPTVTNSNANGIYTATVNPDQPGIWLYTFTASGSVTTVQGDQFTVAAGNRMLVASMEEFKAHLRRTDLTDDAMLRTFLVSATDVVEHLVGGPLGTATFTERRTVGGTGAYYAGVGRLAFTHRPVISITSITPDFAGALDPTSYVLDQATGTAQMWTWWRGWMTVVYKAGYQGLVPEKNRLGGLMIAQHLWQVENGGGGLPFPNDNEPMVMVAGYSVPHRAVELLDGDLVPGIA